MKIFIIAIREKARRIRVQIEHGRQTNVDHEKRDREGSEERSSIRRRMARVEVGKEWCSQNG